MMMAGWGWVVPMTDAEWCIEIKQRGNADDGRPRYNCYIHIEPMPQYCSGGTNGHSIPAYSQDGVVQTVRGVLDDIRGGQWKQDDKPRPRPANTELQDETGAFSVADFFDSGTLTAFMAPGQTGGS